MRVINRLSRISCKQSFSIYLSSPYVYDYANSATLPWHPDEIFEGFTLHSLVCWYHHGAIPSDQIPDGWPSKRELFHFVRFAVLDALRNLGVSRLILVDRHQTHAFVKEHVCIGNFGERRWLVACDQERSDLSLI